MFHRHLLSLWSLSLFLGLACVSILPLSPHSGSAAANDQAANQLSKREAAYRANNVGVALLEQYKPKDAAESFTQALEIKSDLLIARINLAIALYYLPDAEGAKHEAEKALTQDANAPQPHYILGLIARAQNRFDSAIAEFKNVLKTDPDDVGANINLGQVFVQQKRQAEAIAAFRKAIAAEPYNETALYNLGILLTRTGAKEEGQRLIQKFQQFRQSGAGTIIGTNYLEQGRYAEAIVSTGAESDLVDRTTPEVKFVEATPVMLSVVKKPAESASSRERPPGSSFEEGGKNLLASDFQVSATLFDFDNDGNLDLLELNGNEVRLWRNDKGKFVDVTSQAGALKERSNSIPIVAVAGDYDNDGLTDLLVVYYGKVSLYHNDGNGKFSDRSKQAGIAEYPYLAISAAFVDVDHDGDLDIFIAGFADLASVKVEPLLGKNGPLLKGSTESFARAVQSGVVQPFEAIKNLPGAPNLLLRNNGNGTFTDITEQANVHGALEHAVAIVPTDYNNRRDVDLLVVNYGTSPELFSNQRDGSFRNVAREAGLEIPGKWTCVAAGDVNKDGFTDFFFGRGDGPGLLALSDGRIHFKTVQAPAATAGASAAQFLDYDNDGLLDLAVVADGRLRVWRNVGDNWIEVSERAVDLQARAAGGRTLSSGDFDADGDVDLILRSGGSVRILRNDGGNHNHSVTVNLHGRVSNRSAVEAKVEMRAGSLWQKLETYSASPAPAPADVIFGLGKRERPDAVRVLWPAGIVQAETEFPSVAVTREGNSAPSFITLNITELDRKPSSCPYLYAWNGEQFEFVTDFMGGGEMGYLEEPGPYHMPLSEPGAVATGQRKHPARYNKPEPDEYVRIRSDQLKEKDGRYELRVTNELEEALFVDRLQLMVVTHPIGTEVYPNEGMSDPPKPFKLLVTKGARPPLSAVDDHGHDVLDLISYLDRRWPDDFKVDPIRGYAGEHTLTMKLGDAGTGRNSKRQPNNDRLDSGLGRGRRGTSPSSKRKSNGGTGSNSKQRLNSERIVLLLTGWTDYAWSSDNVAAAQAGKTMKPPALQVKDKNGNWRTVIEDIGIPVGRPQTVTVDLTGKFLSPSREVRIVTNMRVYWDQILVDTSDGDSPMKITRLDPSHADLRWRGFSAEVTPDGREPFGYDYRKVLFSSPWKVMTGHYTREGDVRELLLKSDDMFVICRPGDEISLSFDAASLPSLPEGWTRTFMLYADGFSKEMDINSASPDQLAPLPFHGMSHYPYRWPEHYPFDEKHREYIEKYNTRVVTASLATLVGTDVLVRRNVAK